MIFPYSRMGRMRVLKSLLNDLQFIPINERLIKPVIRFPLFIQSFMCFLNFSSAEVFNCITVDYFFYYFIFIHLVCVVWVVISIM